MLKEQKVDLSAFEQLATKFQQDFHGILAKLVDDRYHMGTKLIDKKVAAMEVNLSKHINKQNCDLKAEMLAEIDKKACLKDFRDQLGQVKTVIEKMVEESVESFASKEETKKALLLFEKKFIKLEVVLEEMLNEALKNDSEQQNIQCLTLPGRRDKEVMNSFGRKRRI